MINWERANASVQDFPDQRGLVAYDGDALHRQPGLVQPPGGIAGVEIAYPAGEQLGAGGDDFAVHHSSCQWSVVSGQ